VPPSSARRPAPAAATLFSPSRSRLWQKGDEGRNALGFPHPSFDPGFDRAKSALVRRIASDGHESATLLQAVVRAVGQFLRTFYFLESLFFFFLENCLVDEIDAILRSFPIDKISKLS
jgi:hypothetical protein